MNKPSTLRGGRGGKVVGEKCNVAVVRWWQGARTTATMCHRRTNMKQLYFYASLQFCFKSGALNLILKKCENGKKCLELKGSIQLKEPSLSLVGGK